MPMQRQIIIGVLLVVVALVGIFIYARYQRSEQPAAEQQQQQTPLPGYGTIKIPPQ